MSRLFNAYVIVDWSASAKPKTGKDSIWIGVLKRDVRFRLTFEAHNPSTRAEAMTVLADVLSDLRRRSERVLIGFDFPLGYPAGTAKMLDLKPADWRGQWAFMTKNVVDKPNNTNNRFAVAAKMNRLMTDEAQPFWGCPVNDAQRWLTTTKPTARRADLPAELRHADKAAKGAKSIWQIFGNGTVGSQAIVGIPHVAELKKVLGDKAKVWPFETGWRAQTSADFEGLEAVVAEIYPALAEVKPEGDEIIDRAQVRALCEQFARLDEAGKLGAAFGPQSAVSTEVLDAVEQEEGWILGV